MEQRQLYLLQDLLDLLLDVLLRDLLDMELDHLNRKPQHPLSFTLRCIYTYFVPHLRRNRVSSTTFFPNEKELVQVVMSFASLSSNLHLSPPY